MSTRELPLSIIETVGPSIYNISKYIAGGLGKFPGKVLWTLTTSSVARKATFSGILYLMGGTIISTVGLIPVMATTALVWIF